MQRNRQPRPAQPAIRSRNRCTLRARARTREFTKNRYRGENWGLALPPASRQLFFAPEPSEETFFDSGLRIEKCVLASLRPPVLPSSL
jgi:hypothetical protein